jgi:hypothetical protein
MAKFAKLDLLCAREKEASNVICIVHEFVVVTIMMMMMIMMMMIMMMMIVMGSFCFWVDVCCYTRLCQE